MYYLLAYYNKISVNSRDEGCAIVENDNDNSDIAIDSEMISENEPGKSRKWKKFCEWWTRNLAKKLNDGTLISNIQ